MVKENNESLKNLIEHLEMSKQSSFLIRTVLCADGERLPTLIDSESGLPVFDATRWVLTSLRSQNLASATIEQALRSLIPFYVILRSHGIDLPKRMDAGRLLDPSELEALADAAKRSIIAIPKDQLNRQATEDTPKIKQPTNVERLRAPVKRPSPEKFVSASTSAIRLGYIRSFIKWRVNLAILSSNAQRRLELIEILKITDEELKNKTPSPKGRISKDHINRLKRRTKFELPEANKSSAASHSKKAFIESRDNLILRLLYTLGIRRSELLGLKIKDFNGYMQEVSILRRPDDIDDPRLSEPNTKTRERLLPINSETYKNFKDHLPLRQLVVKGKHEFLIASCNGRPLSKTALNKIFRNLNSEGKITPHMLRHAYCESLAEELYKNGHSENEILTYLRRLCGWSDNSNTPKRYLTRFINEQADLASIRLQEKLLK